MVPLCLSSSELFFSRCFAYDSSFFKAVFAAAAVEASVVAAVEAAGVEDSEAGEVEEVSEEEEVEEDVDSEVCPFFNLQVLLVVLV